MTHGVGSHVRSNRIMCGWVFKSNNRVRCEYYVGNSRNSVCVGLVFIYVRGKGVGKLVIHELSPCFCISIKSEVSRHLSLCFGYLFIIWLFIYILAIYFLIHSWLLSVHM